jgi:hypothetical protein
MRNGCGGLGRIDIQLRLFPLPLFAGEPLSGGEVRVLLSPVYRPSPPKLRLGPCGPALGSVRGTEPGPHSPVRTGEGLVLAGRHLQRIVADRIGE